MLGVGGEIVPEMLEINAFAAVYQRERRLAVKMEMPEIAHQPHVAPVSDARQEGVHQRNPVHLARILRRIGVGDHQPDIVPDNPNVLVAQFAHERVYVLRHFGLGVAIGWRGRLTGSAQIGRDHGVGACELRHQRAPHVAGFGVTMQEDDWVARARDQIVQAHAVDIREMALHRWFHELAAPSNDLFRSRIPTSSIFSSSMLSLRARF